MREVSGASINGRRVFTLAQELVVKEYVEAYGLSREDIYFDGESDEPYFSYEALSLLSLLLSTDIKTLSMTPIEIDRTAGLVTVNCEVILVDGRSRAPFAMAQIGETMPGGDPVKDINQAVGLAQARAARRALNMVGFNVTKAHEARKNSGELKLTLAVDDPRTIELREGHSLGEELGLIVGDDKGLWRQEISAFTRGECDSMGEMDDKSRGHWIIHLRTLKRFAPTKAASLAGTGGA